MGAIWEGPHFGTKKNSIFLAPKYGHNISCFGGILVSKFERVFLGYCGRATTWPSCVPPTKGGLKGMFFVLCCWW